MAAHSLFGKTLLLISYFRKRAEKKRFQAALKDYWDMFSLYYELMNDPCISSRKWRE